MESKRPALGPRDSKASIGPVLSGRSLSTPSSCHNKHFLGFQRSTGGLVGHSMCQRKKAGSAACQAPAHGPWATV